jgi:hypothetical protein
MLTVTRRGTSGSHAIERGRWDRWSVWAVTVVVLGCYGLWTAAALRHGPQGFIHLGRIFVSKSQASPAISSRAGSYQYDGEIGFDGQFAYYLAVDPVNARYYMDSPAYRYTRIVYPLTARVLALGRADLIPYTLVLVNLAMIGVGTLALAAWLRRKGVSAWYAAVYGFYPGVLIALQRDVTEVMAYGLVAVAIYLFDFAKRPLVWSSIVFAVAILTRETTAIFAIGYGLSLLFEGEGVWLRRVRHNVRRAAVFLTVCLFPIVLYKIFLLSWIGSLGFDAHVEHMPFGGILAWYPWQPGQVAEVQIVVIPAVICGLAAIWALLRGIRRVETWMLLVNVLILVVFLERPAFNDISSAGRITTGVALAAVLSLPYFAGRFRAWFWAAAVLWLWPMLSWFFLPLVRGSLAALRRRF